MRSLIFALLLFAGLAACKQSVTGKNGVTYKSPSAYNDYIVNRQTQLMKRVMDFGKVADLNLDSAEQLLQQSVKETAKMVEEIEGMPPYKGDSSLRDAAAASFRFYKRVFEKDYAEILAIRKKGPENISTEDVSEANRIVAKISKEEEGFDKAFHLAQQQYASKHNMKLLDNKMQQEIDKMKE